jgi:hypothetical protein
MITCSVSARGLISVAPFLLTSAVLVFLADALMAALDSARVVFVSISPVFKNKNY